MSRSAAQIMASARRLAPARQTALKADRDMVGRVRSMARRLRSEGVLGPEIASLFGVSTQQIYSWLNGHTGPNAPTPEADAVRAEARALAAERRRVRKAADKVNERSRSLAVEVDRCADASTGEFVEILGVHRSQYYTWLDQADRLE